MPMRLSTVLVAGLAAWWLAPSAAHAQNYPTPGHYPRAVDSRAFGRSTLPPPITSSRIASDPRAGLYANRALPTIRPPARGGRGGGGRPGPAVSNPMNRMPVGRPGIR